ncbi:serine threonine protein kinase, CMGC group [Xylaria digitata]|nr:serine threonine protein kinase, CMGC group [Xylaria digitata]
MASLLRRLRWPIWPRKPIAFSNSNFARIPVDQTIEEEVLPDYRASRYYPVRIGEVLRDRYQVVGKLGFGASSTLFINSVSMGAQLDNELNMYKRMKEKGSVGHPGRNSVRKLLDSFDVEGPDGRYRCLVHPPLWESVLTVLHRNPVTRLPVPVLAGILYHLFLALDFLNRECAIIHTDIKADNIMFGIRDDSVFRDFEEQELSDPSPRKVLGDRKIYTSHELRIPKEVGEPVLCDFGSGVCGDEEHQEDVQPNVYRAPEVILGAPWTYKIDIWNAGCMVWDIFEGGHLFTGQDPEFHAHRRELHSEISVPDPISLEEIETNLEGRDKESFLLMMRMMLQWEPSLRSSAKELVNSEWLQGQM